MARPVTDERRDGDARATQADAQGFKKPSPGFILDPSQSLTELKNAQIEVRGDAKLETSRGSVFLESIFLKMSRSTLARRRAGD